MKPIKFYTTPIGPNPLKVLLVLSILELPYEESVVHHSKLKTPEYTVINPNGRLPALYDPNQNLVLWESAAMIEYLVETYDTKEPRKLGFAPGTTDYWHARQWLYFQASGQGPYYGQASWFKRFHPDPQPSALQRYVDETKRVMVVLDSWLEKQPHGWLVGDKMSYADLAFMPWQRVISKTFVDEGLDGSDLPYFRTWMQKMEEAPKVKETLSAAQAKADAEWPKMMAWIQTQKNEDS